MLGGVERCLEVMPEQKLPRSNSEGSYSGIFYSITELMTGTGQSDARSHRKTRNSKEQSDLSIPQVTARPESPYRSFLQGLRKKETDSHTTGQSRGPVDRSPSDSADRELLAGSSSKEEPRLVCTGHSVGFPML